jgi:hypothetical protein
MSFKIRSPAKHQGSPLVGTLQLAAQGWHLAYTLCLSSLFKGVWIVDNLPAAEGLRKRCSDFGGFLGGSFLFLVGCALFCSVL